MVLHEAWIEYESPILIITKMRMHETYEMLTIENLSVHRDVWVWGTENEEKILGER